MPYSTTNPPRNFIYALKDPFTDAVRYIGKTDNLRRRLSDECREISNTHRCHWIQLLIRQGVKPIQVVLEELPIEADWKGRERYWIAYGRAQDWPLTNGTDGGDGVTGLSPESRERITKSSRGRKATPETRIKIGLASKGRQQSRETRQKRSESLKGRYFSPEVRKKISTGNSKLTSAQADEIRKMLDANMTQRAIAKIYGVHPGTISNIKCNKFYIKSHA